VRFCPVALEELTRWVVSNVAPLLPMGPASDRRGQHAAVLVALALTAVVSARLGGASRSRAAARMVAGGTLAMAVAFGIGHLVAVGI
jgi:VIT1/CCC1 family predicted Fe2+/Mn2+ transporter